MAITFPGLRAAFFQHTAAYAAKVCPDAPAAAAPAPESAPAPALAPSAWAEKHLQFTPSAKQAQILDSGARFLILCCNRQWGKTTTIALKTLHRAISTPGQAIVIISRTKFQAGILIERACRFARRLGYPVRRYLGERFSLALPNGSSILAVSHCQDTSAGNTADVLVVDEAALVQDLVYSSVTAFTSRTRGAIWLLSTPRRQVGFFYNIWHDGDQRWLRVLSTVKDCPDIDPEFLKMQQALDPIKYRQDFLCEFIQPANRLVTREALDNLVDPTLSAWKLQKPQRP